MMKATVSPREDDEGECVCVCWYTVALRSGDRDANGTARQIIYRRVASFAISLMDCSTIPMTNYSDQLSVAYG